MSEKMLPQPMNDDYTSTQILHTSEFILKVCSVAFFPFQCTLKPGGPVIVCHMC